MRVHFFLILFLLLSACQQESATLAVLDIGTEISELEEGIRKPVAIRFYDYGLRPRFEITAGTKLRGNYSLRHPKKSLDIRFDEERAFGRLGASRRWSLNANYIDKTFLRNKLSYYLFGELGNLKSPDSEFVWLFSEGKDLGLYEIVERVNEDFLELADDKCACVFKDVNFTAHPDSIPIWRASLQNYFENDPRFASYPSAKRKELVKNAFYDQKYPDAGGKIKTQEIELLSEFVNLSTAKSFEDAVWEVFDKESILAWHLLLLLSNNGDGLIKNYYLYKRSCSDKWEICPWDYEHGYGRDGDGEPNRGEVLDFSRNTLLFRLWKDDVKGYRADLLNLYEQHKSELLSSHIVAAFLNEEHRKIDAYIRKDADLWPYAELPYFENATPSSELNDMIAWYESNLITVESLLKQKSK